MENNERRAYVTFLSGRKFLPGVWLLNSTLHDVRARYPLVVCIPEDDKESYPELDAWKIKTRRVLGVQIGKDYQGGVNKQFSKNYMKLRAMGLTEYSKVVLIDSDMYVAKNIDHIFDYPSMTAVAAGGSVFPDWIKLNGGLIVIEPDKAQEEKLLSFVEPAIKAAADEHRVSMGEQDVFNDYMPDWPERNELHLTDDYNALQPFLGWICKKLPDGYDSIYIFHYVGSVKPWAPTMRHRAAVLYRCMRQRSFAELRSFMMCRKYMKKMPK